TYYVRAVTGGAFGKRKGKSVLFTILPRAATVGVAADQTVTYGENPAALEASFIDGDTLVISELAFLYDDITQAETQVRVQTESIRVLNAAGENVTDCYTYTAVKSAIRFLPREITVQPAAQESTYSGAPILPVNEPSAIVERNLRFGAKMEFSSTVEDAFGNRMQSVVNAGNYTVRADVGSVRITVNGKDVTHLYAPQFADNENAFTVLPRTLTVTTGSDKKPYDGAPLACHTFTAQGQAQGHSVQLRSGATGATQTVVGSTPNAFAAGDFTVTDGEKDTTANYEITVQYGTLTVEKRPLSVITASDSRIYSGAYYSRAEISSDGVAFAAALALSNGQTVYVDTRSFVASVCDFGTAENRFAVRVRDAYYNDTTAYYDITYTYGTLAVQKRSVTITTASASKSYDGTPLYAPDLTAADCENIVFGHTLRAVGVKASITDAGSTENKTQYAIYNGNTDVSGNYSIAYGEACGTLSVTPRQVTIQPTATKIYDGTEKFGNEHIADIYPSGTPDNRKFVGNQMPTLSWKYTDTGEHVNVISGGYSVVLDSYTGNASCNVQNYEIVAYRGTLTVEKRTVRVVPQDLRFTYGDAIHMQPRWTYATDSLHFVGAQEPTLIWACRQGGTPETAGAYNLYLERAEDNAGTDFSANNYNIESTRDATLTVDPREVHLQLTGGTKVYNGKADADHAVKFDEGDTPPALSYAGISAGDTEQAQAHKFLDKDNMREFYIYYTAKDGAYVTPADVGEYYVCMAYLDADPFYYSINYKIIEDNVGQATLTVTPRPVTVRAEDIGGGTDTVYYNGAVYDATIRYTVTGGTGFVAGEMPVLGWEFVPKQGYEDRKAGEDAGEYFIRYTGAQANGDFLPTNYTIENAATLGALTITPRQVTVQPSGYKFYDGTEIFGDANIMDLYPYGAGEEQKFVSGQMPLFTYAYTDDGEHKNAGSYAVMCKAASSATCDLRNYAVTMQTFMFYVFARPINIVPENFTRTYSGQAVRAENIAWRYNNSEYLFLEEPALVWEFYEEPINAGTYAFFLQSWQDNPATGFLKANYYVQAYDGTLTIDPLTVYVRAADFSAEKNVHVKEYDGGG
ncbi:MAG: hypothetical protein K2L51_06830, partial [Clostridiales bacterium]|nr:hypothetical protein [Clostridiales bacterium]